MTKKETAAKTPKTPAAKPRATKNATKKTAVVKKTAAKSTPKKTTTSTPKKPTSKAPKKPTSATPKAPSTKAPKKPASKAPAKAETKAPKKAPTKTPTKAATKAPKKAATKAPKKPATKAAAKSGGKKKAAGKDRSDLLRRLLDLRSGYQRAQDEEQPRRKATKKVAKAPVRPKPKLLRPDPEPPVVEAKKPKKPKKPHVRKRDLIKLQKALESERDQMRHDLDVIDEMTNAKDGGGGIELNAFSIHLAEHATDNSTLETTLMQRHLIEERMAQVLDALKRIEEGLFGQCELCGNTISVERLLAKPFARLCISCRRNLEQRRARSG